MTSGRPGGLKDRDPLKKEGNRHHRKGVFGRVPDPGGKELRDKNHEAVSVSYIRRATETRVFSQSSGLQGNREYSIAQVQGVRPAHGRTASAGKHSDSKAVAWVPQGTCPRPPWEKPNPGLNRSGPSMYRPEPMNEPLPHDVLPWAGCTLWARANLLAAESGGSPKKITLDLFLTHHFRRAIRGERDFSLSRSS